MNSARKRATGREARALQYSGAVNAFPPLNQLETSSSPFSLIKREPLGGTVAEEEGGRGRARG